ncbi:hypothetical protein OQJ15_14730 [Fluoribacter dumoffii]|nr:hypothetical protein [Fluoribacter dumoffii]MCW8387560.1 hypothetical protein [Fluoribacter dumoffii]MCW8497763.1 hypothetical protein [Fluoribacter dumoffii]
MDATRTDFNFLLQAIKVAVEAKALTINIPDTVGYTMPEEYRILLSKLVSHFPDICFSVHCHNDLGLATANSLAGLLGGARQVECTINGIGERAGNASLEEIVMGIKTRKDVFNFQTNVNTQKIFEISHRVADATGFAVQKNKAIVGANAFTHESGIHQKGVLKNKSTIEIIDPTDIGIPSSKVTLGKHSGKAGLRHKTLELGLQLDKEQLLHLFHALKKLSAHKKIITDEDLLSVYALTEKI